MIDGSLEPQPISIRRNDPRITSSGASCSSPSEWEKVELSSLPQFHFLTLRTFVDAPQGDFFASSSGTCGHAPRLNAAGNNSCSWLLKVKYAGESR